MTLERRSLHELHPEFLIPVGTQVALKVKKFLPGVKLPDGNPAYRPAGTVGVVSFCPESNQFPYRIRLADDSELEAMFAELAIRRLELERTIGISQENFEPYIIYRCLVGSRAFGLATETSDDDYRGIYLPPARAHWSMRELPGQIEIMRKPSDEVYWELEKFLRLALQANPNILEVLYTPLTLQVHDIARELLSIREAFLSRHIYKTYSGYVLSQFRRMSKSHEATGKYKPKHAMHLIRLLHSGIHALRKGEIRVDVSEYRDELLHIKTGNLSFEEVRRLALETDRKFQQAYEETALPEEPDFERVDSFLISARRHAADWA